MQIAAENPDRSIPFACDMSALSPAERRRHIATTKEVFGTVQEIRELPNGYSFRLPDEDGVFMQAAAFVSRERLCCPFFGFGIELEPNGRAVWLRLTGREGVKPFIREEFGGRCRMRSPKQRSLCDSERGLGWAAEPHGEDTA
jgi:hypothetical protein